MIQIQLTDSQTTILSTACARQDRMIFPVTARLKGGAVGNVLKSLLTKGLIEEIPATDDMTVWRFGDNEVPLTLRASEAGYALLHADGVEDVPLEPQPAPATGCKTSKQDILVAMLKRPEGASIAEIMAATNWQPHSIRGAIAGVVRKKLDLEVTSEKHETRGRIYTVCA